MDAIRKRVAPGALSDPDVVRYAAGVSVWDRWFVWLVSVFELAYRPGFWYPEDIEFLPLPVLVVLNGLVHHRLLTNRPVTWRWMLFLSAADIALITFGIVIGGGFRSFIFLAYYPSLAIFAVVFWSRWLSLAWTTAAAVQAPALLNDAVEAILSEARLPREQDRRGKESTGRAARRGLVDIQAKTPARGSGPKPQSSGRV